MMGPKCIFQTRSVGSFILDSHIETQENEEEDF
jgi:hypothetical protein